ncbi:MAG: hypothetical protein ACTSWC_13100 [Promethearchaeota archaeon]
MPKILKFQNENKLKDECETEISAQKGKEKKLPNLIGRAYSAL